MPASNSLGEQFKLYHSSHQEFEPGDMIKPGEMVPHIQSRPEGVTGKNWSDDFHEAGHNKFVWMTTNPEASYGKNLYEVEPQGLTERYSYRDAAPYNRGTGLIPDEHRSKETHVSLAPAKVLRRGKLAGPHPDNPGISKIEWDD